MLDDFLTEGRASARPILAKQDMPPDALGSWRKHRIHLPPGERDNRAVVVFVTVCAVKRRAILASPRIHQTIVSAWRGASTWPVGRYVVMPDHIHFFCAPNGNDIPSLERWMRYWKSVVTKGIGAKCGDVWQRDHWDRQLRSVESYADKWESVRRNPVRHGYCDDPDEWPFQGELNILRW
jgi:REP element-mobilizing transposase RayT